MIFILTGITYHRAEKEMPCDACEMFWSKERPINYKGIDFSDILLFYKAKHGKIREGERYLQLAFVDEWGEQHEFKALESMHKFLFRMSLYDGFMMDAMIEYRRLKRIEKSAQIV